MNHENLCLCWVAHNLGHENIRSTIGKGRHQRDVRLNVHPSAKGSRIRYDGDQIFSHHWWCMARFVRAPNGTPVVLYRGVSYSKSTGKHQSYVRDAVRESDILLVPVPWTQEGADFNPTHDQVFQACIGQVTEGFTQALNARSKVADYLIHCEEVLERMRMYSHLFEVPIPVWANPFEKDPARIEELEYKLTMIGVREGVSFNPFWRAP